MVAHPIIRFPSADPHEAFSWVVLLQIFAKQKGLGIQAPLRYTTGFLPQKRLKVIGACMSLFFMVLAVYKAECFMAYLNPVVSESCQLGRIIAGLALGA